MKNYHIENSKKLEEFLLKNSKLTEILLATIIFAEKKIKEIFGHKVELHLRIHEDPEEDWEEILIVIKSSCDAKTSRKLMDKLDEEWFLDVMPKLDNKLCITEEPL